MGAISRKDFLKGAAIGAAGVVAESTTRPHDPGQGGRSDRRRGRRPDRRRGRSRRTHHRRIEAASLGAKVLLLDKEPEIGGTARVAGGTFSAANSKAQLEKGIEDSPAQHCADCQKIGMFKADSDLLQLYVENAAATADWLGSIGVKYEGPDARSLARVLQRGPHAREPRTVRAAS